MLLFLRFNDDYKTYIFYKETFLYREGHLVFCLLHNMQSLPQKREAFFSYTPHSNQIVKDVGQNYKKNRSKFIHSTTKQPYNESSCSRCNWFGRQQNVASISRKKFSSI